ncbi:endosialin [Lepisosteus oculatus]|uniref:endosialin n=1 Tax=Lepisosteus oculatus TaxID=7918 RepID=UPI0035F50EE5
MGPLWRSCLLASLLWLAGAGLAQDLGERDALCRPGGCYAVYFQRKTFLDAWRSCRDRGGNLATVKRPEEAALIHELFSGLEPRAAARARARIWIGLQRQPRQCSATRPLRGFTWITGDQDTQYTHWLREDSPSTCAAPRCVVMTHSQDPRDRQDNLKWQDGSCTLPVDGYLCRYAYRGMCPPLESEGGGPVLYSTPFHLVSALLSHVPFGSVASVPCPEGTRGDQSALCLQREDGGTGWSREAPFCSDAPRDWCRRDNGGCQHLCRAADAHYYCECLEGYELGADGQSCGPADACRGDPCEFECHAAGGGFLCACPEGYLLAPDGRGCLDVDECLGGPCQQRCLNAPGTFECACEEGWRAAGGGRCEDVDECRAGPCEHACENRPGSYECHCRLGYAAPPGEPTRCLDVDECQIPGTCQQMCVNYEGGFECHCGESYALEPDGASCRPLSAAGAPPPPAAAAPSPPPPPPPLPWPSGLPDFGWIPGDPAFGWAPELPGWPTDTPPLDWPTDTPPPEWPTDTPHPDLPTDTPLLDWPTDTPPPEWPTDTPHPDLPTDTPLLDWPTDTPPPHWPTDTPHPDLPTDTPLLDWPTDTPALDWPTDTPHPDRPTDTPPPHWPTDTPPLDWPTDTPALDWLTYQPGLVWVPPDFGWETDTPPEGLTTTHPENRGRPTSGRAAPPDPTPDRWRTGRIGEVPPSSPPAAASEHQGAPSPGTPGATAAAAGSGGRASPEDEEGGTSGWHSPPSPPSTAGPPGTPTPPAPGSEAPPGGISRQRRDNSWLLVALLVPLSIFVVVMVALGIVYCTRCAVRPRSKSVADCYRWITSSAGKQGV